MAKSTAENCRRGGDRSFTARGPTQSCTQCQSSVCGNIEQGLQQGVQADVRVG